MTTIFFLKAHCYFDCRSINDYLLSSYYDHTVYSHSLTNKKRPTSKCQMTFVREDNV